MALAEVPTQRLHAGARSVAARRGRAGGRAMSPSKLANDVRREQRVPARLQIELTLDERATSESGSTINISANGVYFHSKRYLEPLTMLGLRILLPGEKGPAAALDVRGVVVRVEPEEPSPDVDHYEVACFFTDTTPEFRERLGLYVQTNL
jgi:hypothetical protein